MQLRSISAAAALYLVALLTACTTFNLLQPQTLDERIAYAEAGLTGAYNSLADVAKRESITKERARKIFDELSQADSILRVARQALVLGHTDAAEAQLARALELLTIVDAKLREARE